MNPKELKENFSAQLEKAQSELTQLRQAVLQRESVILKLQGAIEAMDLQLSEVKKEEQSDFTEE